MRWSKFINFYEIGDDTIIFNSVTRGVSKMAGQELKLIDEYIKGSFKEKITEDMKDVIAELYLEDYIVTNNYREKEVFSKVRYSRDEAQAVVMYFIPTFNCNFRCPYCIISATDHDCTVDDTMSDEDTVLAANWLINYISKNNLKKLTVELFGGEPMLGHKQNLLFLNTLTKLKEQGVELKFNMISNCYLLSDENLTELKQAGVESIQCTIDGPKEINDKRRILSDGGGSFDRIIENIKLCRKHDISVTIRINIDEENVTHIVSLIEFLKKNKFHEYVTIGLAPVDPPLKDVNISGHNEKVMNYMPEIYNKLREEKFRFLMWETFCGNGTKNFFVICPDGSLYNCPSYAGIEGHSIGNIREEEFYPTRKYMHEIPEKCFDCNLVGVCAGGCYFTKTVHDLKDYCLEPTHFTMMGSYITSKYR